MEVHAPAAGMAVATNIISGTKHTKRELAFASSLFSITKIVLRFNSSRETSDREVHSVRIQNNLCQTIFELLHVKLGHKFNTNQEKLWHLLKS